MTMPIVITIGKSAVLLTKHGEIRIIKKPEFDNNEEDNLELILFPQELDSQCLLFAYIMSPHCIIITGDEDDNGTISVVVTQDIIDFAMKSFTQ